MSILKILTPYVHRPSIFVSIRKNNKKYNEIDKNRVVNEILNGISVN